MSVAQHEAMARREEEIAALHEKQHDQKARAAPRCPEQGSEAGAACWTSSWNPTDAHAEEARRHRKMAADHRAASAALRDAEAHACAGIPDIDRDMSPFAHREDIESVSPLDFYTPPSTAEYVILEGAIVRFRRVSGLTATWLQRVVDCHLARNAALGHDVPEMPYCPLVPRSVHATVKESADAIVVEIRSDDEATAREVWRRAQMLAPVR